jgi:cyclic pyranopterin phosphate synthase
MAKKLSHVDPAGRPRMVDVGAKTPTLREATAEARVRFPAGDA